jgi:hypothetical protein
MGPVSLAAADYGGAMDLESVRSWVERYEQAWRTPGTDVLADLFVEDASYLASPWAAPVRGMAELRRWWDAERSGPAEHFTFTWEAVAVEGDTAVVRVEVDYADQESGRWRDLWVIRFADDGRCRAFEEWPFAPDQPDGH